ERASGPEHAGDLRERGRGRGEMLDDVGEQDRVHARCRESDGVKVALAYVEVPALAGDPYRLWARLDAEHLRIPTVSDGAQEVAGAAAHVQHPCRRPQVAPQRSHIAPALPVAHAGRDPAPGEGRVILRVEARQLLSHRTGIEVAEAAAPAADQA